MTWMLVLWAAAATAQDEPASAVLKKAIELHQAGKYAAVIDAYREFLRARPDAADVRSNLGNALAHEGRFAEAIREYTAALGPDPSHTGIRFNLGLTYYKSGDFLHAAEQFEKVRASEAPDSDQGVKSSILLADCYRRQGEDKKVIALLYPMVDRRPDDVAAAYLLGTALLHEDEQERAVHILERMMSRGDTAEVRLLLAITKMRPGELDGALADIRRCLELSPA